MPVGEEAHEDAAKDAIEGFAVVHGVAIGGVGLRPGEADAQRHRQPLMGRFRGPAAWGGGPLGTPRRLRTGLANH